MCAQSVAGGGASGWRWGLTAWLPERIMARPGRARWVAVLLRRRRLLLGASGWCTDVYVCEKEASPFALALRRVTLRRWLRVYGLWIHGSWHQKNMEKVTWQGDGQTSKPAWSPWDVHIYHLLPRIHEYMTLVSSKSRLLSLSLLFFKW